MNTIKKILDVIKKIILNMKFIVYNKLHIHKYNIIGTGFKGNGIIEVDVICKCGKCGTVFVNESCAKTVIDQASSHKYLRVPYIYVLGSRKLY